VQEGLGGGRCAARCRHGQKGGRWPVDGRLLRQDDHRGGISLRDAEPLRQGGEGASGGIAEGPERCEADGEQDGNPLIGFALCNFPNFVALVISIQRRTIRITLSPAFRIAVAPTQ
jgi:hypothetical protein